MRYLHLLILMLLVGSAFADCIGYNDSFYVRALDAKYRAIEGANVWIKYDRGTSFGDKYFTTPPIATNESGAVYFSIANQGTRWRDIDCNIIASASVGDSKADITITPGIHGQYVDVVLSDVYRLNFHVANQEGVALNGANIEINNKILTTDSNGNAKIYLKKGQYNYLASYLSSKQSGSIDMQDDLTESVAVQKNAVRIEVVDDQGNYLPARLRMLNQTYIITNGTYQNDQVYGEGIEYSIDYNTLVKSGTIEDGKITRVVYDLTAPTFGVIQTDLFNGKIRLKLPIADQGTYASGIDASTLKVTYRAEPSNGSSEWQNAVTYVSARNEYTSEFPTLPDNKIINFKAQISDRSGNKATIEGRFSTYTQNTPQNDTNSQNPSPDDQGIPLLYIIIGVIIVILGAYLVIRMKNKPKPSA
ncbi:MAG: hypothetical protein ACP5N9_03810 [Candidatus Bilamarchaeum sp.]